MIHPDRAYSVKEAAEFLGLCTKKVQAMAAAGEFGDEAFAHYHHDGKTVAAYRITGGGINAYRRRNRIKP